MASKCTICDRVAQTPEEEHCECKNPNFIKCANVHYIHTEGEGRLVCTQQKSIKFSDKETTIEKVALNLACISKEIVPITSRATTQVTCAKCIEFIKEQEASNDSN